MEIKGTFDAKRFYETLAAILSRKYGASVSVEYIKEKTA